MLVLRNILLLSTTYGRVLQLAFIPLDRLENVRQISAWC